MDDLRIWNVALSEETIYGHYTNPQELEGNESNLRAYYRFNNSWLDETANSYDLTGYNSPSFSEDTPEFSGGINPGIPTTYYYSYGTTTATGKQYIGQYFDTSTDLSYLNARYYDPGRGQFLSQDPVFWNTKQNLQDPQSLNSYSYASNNPITRSDPTGMFWWKEFYTDWGNDGYCVMCFDWDNGLILKAGEVLGGRFSAQDAISSNDKNILNSSNQSGVNPSIYKAIIYEENSHQFPPFGGERAIENAYPQLFNGGVGVMQVSAKTSGISNKALLNDKTNVSAAGSILQNIQSVHGNDVSAVGSVYNSGGLTSPHGQRYGQRINSYVNSSFAPTMGDRAVRATAKGVSAATSKALAGIAEAIQNIANALKSLF